MTFLFANYFFLFILQQLTKKLPSSNYSPKYSLHLFLGYNYEIKVMFDSSLYACNFFGIFFTEYFDSANTISELLFPIRQLNY